MQTLSFSHIAGFVWKYFKRKPWWLLLIIFSILLQAGTELLWPYLLGEFTQYLTTAQAAGTVSFERAFFYILLIAASSAVYWILRILNHFTYDRLVKIPAMKQAAMDTFSKVQHFSTAWHENSFAGATVRKITRGIHAIELFSDRFYDHFFPLTFIVIGVIITIFLRWPVMGAVLTIGLLLYVSFSIWLSVRFITPVARRHARGDNRLGAALADSISCQATVRSFGQEKQEYKRLDTVATDWQERFWQNYFMHNKLTLFQNILVVLLMILFFGQISWIWAYGNADAGDVIFVLMSFYLVMEYLKNIDSAFRELQTATRDMEDMVAFCATAPQVSDQPGARKIDVPEGKIVFHNVTFIYPGQKQPVYQNLNLVIQPGEKIALVGHSGGGKSTLVKLIQRLYDLEGGEILIDGQNIAAVTQESLHHNIALVPQEPLLFHRSLAENIAYAKPDATPKEIEKAAKLAHAHEFIRTFPQGYDTLVGERGVKLSGGERQRVAIARAILAAPPILILDEATSSLDSQSEKYIQDALHHLLQGRTAIIIAHRLSTVKSADRILVFENGAIQEEGTHEQLVRKKNGIYRGMFELQAGGFLNE